MPDVHAELTTERDPDELAKLVTDFYGIHLWSPVVADTVRDETRPGTRLCTLANGATIAEELVASGPTFVRYRMIADENSPMSDYVGELRVSAREAGGSVLTWEASFRCDPSIEERMSGSVRSTFDGGLAGLVSA
jgi:hypothetical protein